MGHFLLILATVLFTIFVYFSITFFIEKERRASLMAILSGVVICTPLFIIGRLFYESNLIVYILISIYGFVGVLLVFPFRKYTFKIKDKLPPQFDERQIMFSRRELEVDSERFNSYYSKHPEHKDLDDKFRAKPGLMSPLSQKYHPLKFASADANFEVVASFKQNIEDKQIRPKKIETDPKVLTNYIKKWLKHLGVVSVGVTELKTEHFYSHRGRGEEYGKEVKNQHKYAIAFTVEMNKEMMDMAPNAETVLESAQQYLFAGNISAQLAVFIRNLGYSARPHFDGNYEIVCPLVARDAGLGEFGRMGLLMTPELGPRVRVGVVTTDIPLVTNSYKADYSVFDFCTKCKKCADNCPSRAISFEKMDDKDDVSRWTINHEACFTYWSIVGTDCGKCVQVCPYSHPNNFMHNLIRKGIKNSRVFASFALQMDDLFYGRKPTNKHYISPLD